jgi:hypothetical protein
VELIRFGKIADKLDYFFKQDQNANSDWLRGRAEGYRFVADWLKQELADENIKKCADCGKWHLAEGDPVVNERGENICDACHENYIHCATCEEMKVNDQIADWDTKECFSCYEERVPMGRMA